MWQHCDDIFGTFIIVTANTGKQFVTNYAPEGDFTIEFFENADSSIHKYLLDWRLNIFQNAVRVFGYDKRTIHLSWFNNINKKVFEHKFLGTIIKGLNTYSVTYDDNTMLITSAVFISDGIETNYV